MTISSDPASARESHLAREDRFPGHVIGGRYRIVRRIGAGGMGEVFEVAHTQLPRRFALKTLQPHYAMHEEAVRRFRSEAEVGALLQSPHLVSVFDCQLDGGFPFFVMELLEGEDVRSLLRHAGSLGIERAVRIARGAAAGLRVAHRNGIVHRDLKPANLFLCNTFGEELCKVLDFGVAKVGADSACPIPAPTSVMGKLVGTLAYMAPEQIRADRPVDGRADVYSLGAILYEMIAGRRPFEANSDHELMYKVLHEQVTPIEDVRPECPPPVAALVRTAMSTDPAARQSMNALHDALERLARLGEGLDSGLASSFATAPERPRVAPGAPPRWRTTAFGLAAIGAATALALWFQSGRPHDGSTPTVTSSRRADEHRGVDAVEKSQLAMKEEPPAGPIVTDSRDERLESPTVQPIHSPSRAAPAGVAPAPPAGRLLRVERRNPYLP